MHNSLLHFLLKNGDFLNIDISQGSVATRLGCGGIFVYVFVTSFLLSLTVKEFLKIGQYLVKLWATVMCLVFLTHSVMYQYSPGGANAHPSNPPHSWTHTSLRLPPNDISIGSAVSGGLCSLSSCSDKL